MLHWAHGYLEGIFSNMGLCYCLLHPSQIIGCFGFSRYLYLTMHLDIQYVQIHRKDLQFETEGVGNYLLFFCILNFYVLFWLIGIRLRMNYVLLMVVLMGFYHACGMMKSATFLRQLSSYILAEKWYPYTGPTPNKHELVPE